MKTIEEFADRMTVVVTFLAVLEMAKMRLVNLIVREDYSDFWITKANLAT
jgi:segregation and condensation protein A